MRLKDLEKASLLVKVLCPVSPVGARAYVAWLYGGMCETTQPFRVEHDTRCYTHIHTYSHICKHIHAHVRTHIHTQVSKLTRGLTMPPKLLCFSYLS